MQSPSTVARPPHRRAGCGAIALLVTASLVGLAITELLVRLVAPQPLVRLPEGVWASDSVLGWRRPPNLDVVMNTGERDVRFVTDSAGFRVAPERPASAATRVLMIGDSFVEGTQVPWESTLPAALERRMSAALGQPVTVRAVAASAWDPTQYLRVARDVLARERAAAVIVVLYTGNDVIASRRLRTAGTTVAGTGWRDDVVHRWLLPLNLWLRERSHLYALVKTASRPAATRMGLRRSDIPPTLTPNADLSAWDTTAAVVREIADLSACAGAPALTVLIPVAIQVDTTELASALRAYGLRRHDIDLDQPSRLLIPALAARQLDVADALPALRAATGTAPLYGRIEHHLEPAGNEVVAATIAAALTPLVRGAKIPPHTQGGACAITSTPPPGSPRRSRGG